MEVLSPTTLEEALSILWEKRGKVHVLSGGTDLVIKLKEKMIRPQFLLDITRIEGLSYIEEDDDSIRIGAATKIEELLRSDIIKNSAIPLWEACKVFGSLQIRNLASIGGNVVNASPVGDTLPPLYVLSGKLVLKNKNGERVLNVEDFPKAPGVSVRRDEELLTEIVIQKMKEGHFGFFYKLGPRQSVTISKVSVALFTEINNGYFGEVRIALGAVAPRVIRARKSEEYLRGKRISEEVIVKASKTASTEATPITDLRSTKLYRANMVGALMYRGLSKLLKERGAFST